MGNWGRWVADAAEKPFLLGHYKQSMGFLLQFSSFFIGSAPTFPKPLPLNTYLLPSHHTSKRLELFDSGKGTPQLSLSAPGEEFALSWIHIPKMMFLQGFFGPQPLEIERVRREGSPQGVPTGAAALWSRKKSIEVVRPSDQDASRKACQPLSLRRWYASHYFSQQLNHWSSL